MNDNDDFKQFLPSEKANDDNLSIEIPADPYPVQQERLPSGFDPMGEIQLRGQAYRGLAGGRMPWWVLIAGWFIFGCFAALALHLALTAASLTAWIVLAIALLPLLILGRGTAAKLAARKDREQEQLYPVAVVMEALPTRWGFFNGHD